MLSITGCSDKKINNRWVGAVNQLGIVAVYPPREDIYIGSIYLQVAKPECEKGYEKSNCDFSSVKIAQLDSTILKSLIEDSYENTPEFRMSSPNCQKTLGDKSSALSARDASSSASSTLNCYYEGKVTNTSNNYAFKRIGFPDYNIERETSGSLGAVLPDALMTKLGLSGNNIKKYSVSVPNAVYYSVSMPLLIDKINNTTYKNTGELHYLNGSGQPAKITIPLEHGSLNNLEFTALQLCPKQDCYITVIIPTEVYYSSIFNVSLISDSEIHLAGNVSLDTPKGEPSQFKPETKDNKVSTDPIISNSTDLGYGVASTVNYVSKNSISLKNKYDTLLAVGYRGLAFRVIPAKAIITPHVKPPQFPTPGIITKEPNFNGGIDPKKPIIIN